jgi:hypothetical protein
MDSLHGVRGDKTYSFELEDQVELCIADHSDSPIIAHNEREYHRCRLKRSKKSVIEIFNSPRAPIAEMID